MTTKSQENKRKENPLKAVSDPCCPQTENSNLIEDLYLASPAVNFGFNTTYSEIHVTALVVTDHIVIQLCSDLIHQAAIESSCSTM